MRFEKLFAMALLLQVGCGSDSTLNVIESPDATPSVDDGGGRPPSADASVADSGASDGRPSARPDAGTEGGRDSGSPHPEPPNDLIAPGIFSVTGTLVGTNRCPELDDGGFATTWRLRREGAAYRLDNPHPSSSFDVEGTESQGNLIFRETGEFASGNCSGTVEATYALTPAGSGFIGAGTLHLLGACNFSGPLNCVNQTNLVGIRL